MELYLGFFITVLLPVLLSYLIGTVFSVRRNAVSNRDLEPSSKVADGGEQGIIAPILFCTNDLGHNNEENQLKTIEDVNKVRANERDDLEKAAEVATVGIATSSVEMGGNQCRERMVGSSACGRYSEKKEGFGRGSECLEESSVIGRKMEVEVEGNACGENVVGLIKDHRVVKEFEKEKRGDGEEGLDDWEGIERTEVEEHFKEAVAYVGGEGGEFALSSFSDEEHMQMYGLHKIAMEGPCYDPQPITLNVSARARWYTSFSLPFIWRLR